MLLVELWPPWKVRNEDFFLYFFITFSLLLFATYNYCHRQIKCERFSNHSFISTTATPHSVNTTLALFISCADLWLTPSLLTRYEALDHSCVIAWKETSSGPLQLLVIHRKWQVAIWGVFCFEYILIMFIISKARRKKCRNYYATKT